MAEKYNVKVLAQLPLHIRIREDLDAGNPTVVRVPENEISQAFLQLAEKSLYRTLLARFRNPKRDFI